VLSLPTLVTVPTLACRHTHICCAGKAAQAWLDASATLAMERRTACWPSHESTHCSIAQLKDPCPCKMHVALAIRALFKCQTQWRAGRHQCAPGWRRWRCCHRQHWPGWRCWPAGSGDFCGAEWLVRCTHHACCDYARSGLSERYAPSMALEFSSSSQLS
jgi:hypothetical protein